MADRERDPEWIRAAVRAVGHEWGEYGRTVRAATIAPARFARQWADGERETLNPFACIANALAIVTLFEVLLRLAVHRGGEMPPWFDLLRPALQLFNTAVLASLFHFPLVLLGGRRPWRTSLGIALFATAGPMLPIYLARAAIVPVSIGPTPPPLGVGRIAFIVVLALALLGYLVVMLAGAHQVARWRVALAFVLGSSAFAALILVLKIVTGAR
jgi:hypothetical protein